MYSNMKCYENICNCLRVIQQNINRKLKSANCWQQTSLNDNSWDIFRYFSIKLNVAEAILIDSQSNEVVLMSTHNVCFGAKIRK